MIQLPHPPPVLHYHRVSCISGTPVLPCHSHAGKGGGGKEREVGGGGGKEREVGEKGGGGGGGGKEGIEIRACGKKKE